MIDISKEIADFERGIRGEEIRSGLLGMFDAILRSLYSPTRVVYEVFWSIFLDGEIPGYADHVFNHGVLPDSKNAVESGVLYSRIGDIAAFLARNPEEIDESEGE